MGHTVQNSFKRYEKKYLLNLKQYEAFLGEMSKYMKPDLYGKTTNCTIYYDTDKWDLIRRSIEKPVYKEKLRVRSYGIPKAGDLVFVEIKKKFDDVVYKRRISLPAEYTQDYLAGETWLSPGGQISEEIGWFQKRYQAKPRVYIAYDRISYASKDNSEIRITFDRNIRFRENDLDLMSGDYGEKLLSDDYVLMEIKIPGAAPLWLSHLLSKLKIRPSSFSKYGCYYKTCVLMNHTKESIYHVQFNHAVLHHNSVLPDLHSSITCSGIS